MRTQIGIVGAGPAGLVLAHLLHLQGIESVVLESRTREYCEDRVRAGVLEQGTVDLLVQSGLGERVQREGLIHHGIELRFNRQGHRIDMFELTGGRSITIYGQQEVTKDLINARLAAGAPLFFEVSDLSVHDFAPSSTQAHPKTRPKINFAHAGARHQLECDFIAGCDGFHGVCRPSVPAGALTVFDRTYPFGWLGILAQAAPSSEELIYAHHQRGFALHSMRSPRLTRLYLQCAPEEDIREWSDDRIWQELRTRLADDRGWQLNDGPILQKGVTGMRSFVVEPMRFGSLFLAGDSAHIVPPTGAKGMNLAISDVRILARALAEFYSSGSVALLDRYSEICLRRVWKVQRFSWWMTSMLHRFPDENPFDHRRQIAELDYLTTSRAASLSLAENYTGLPFD
ncbi:MAG: 4-hydroxybenzoate 3-monooxygenase [Candidatus Acidiferrales bacterium]